MIEGKTLGDVAVRLNDYPHMPYWGSLKEAMVQLSLAYEKGHDTVLIFDEAYRLVGTLSQKDILTGLGMRGGTSRKKSIDASWEALLGKKTEKTLSSAVEKFMVKPKAAIPMAEDILEACRMMSQKKVSILPVTNGDRVFGVVRMEDLFRHIANAILRL